MAGAAAGGMVLGGLIGSIGELAKGDGLQPGQAITSTIDSRRDPLNVALAFDALLQLGNLEGAQSILERSSPLNQVIDRINASQLDINRKNAAITVAKRMWESGQGPRAQRDEKAFQAEVEAWNMAVGAGGIDSSLLNQLNPQGRAAFNNRMAETLDKAAQSGVGEARASALRQLSQRVIGQENGGTGSFEALTDVAMNTLSQQRDASAEQQTADVLARANAGGFNPAGLLAEIEKERLRQASASPLQANQLAATLASNEDRDFDNLLKFLAFGSQNAQQSASVTNQAALGSAGITANQLAAANALGAQNPQGQAAGNALSSLGGTVQNFGLLSGLGAFNSEKPGVE